jgi:hypothetical protein
MTKIVVLLVLLAGCREVVYREEPIDFATTDTAWNPCGTRCEGDQLDFAVPDDFAVRVCDGGLCKHTDTLCGEVLGLPPTTWTDTNALVDGSNCAQALTACQACLDQAMSMGYTYDGQTTCQAYVNPAPLSPSALAGGYTFNIANPNGIPTDMTAYEVLAGVGANFICWEVPSTESEGSGSGVRQDVNDAGVKEASFVSTWTQ